MEILDPKFIDEDTSMEEVKTSQKTLHDLYCVISNKTVRSKEKHFISFYKKNRECPGTLVKTGRGYFIDGKQVDQASVKVWADLANDGKLSPYKKKVK